jgi:small-conductance mechanosensitive channel
LIPALHKIGGALLAGVSVVSVVIGLAAQTTLGNLIAGISLIIYRPFRVGDLLQINTPNGVETGVVESISLGYTMIKTVANRRITLSNSSIANQTMINLSNGDQKAIALIPISIGYESDISKARAIAVEIAKSTPWCKEIDGCPVVALGDSSVNLMLRVWCDNALDAENLKYAAIESIKERFDAEGIEIPYSYQNVIIKSADSTQAGSD